jgi:hypothetical protein
VIVRTRFMKGACALTSFPFSLSSLFEFSLFRQVGLETKSVVSVDKNLPGGLVAFAYSA